MSEAPTMTAEQPAAIGPGRLILVVGPSGAGKDTLLGLAKAACADDRNIVFPRRVITREASASEDNEEVEPGRLPGRRWRATNSPCIGKRTAIAMRLSRAIDDDIRAGRTVVANVSRTVIARDAPRLCQRRRGLDHGAAERSCGTAGDAGRGSDGKIEHRLRRTVDEAAAAPDVTIVNTGSAEYHARQFVRVIKGDRWDE